MVYSRSYVIKFKVCSLLVGSTLLAKSFFTLKVSGFSAGEFDITMSSININEEAHPDLTIPYLIASQLYGNVTNDQSISALDATYII